MLDTGGCVMQAETKKNLIIIISLLIISVMMAGCASVGPEPQQWDPFKLVWPLPPDKPRIKYVDSLANDSDVGSSQGLAESIFGEEKMVSLRKPYGVTTDSTGRVYVSDVGGIFVFDKQNKRLSFIGESGAGRLMRPLGLFFSKKNNLLFVADSILDRIKVFTPEGRAVLELGQKGELSDPGGVAVDAERDRVYVTNTKNHTISVFDTKGNFRENIGARGNEEGNFNFPTQIDIDRAGNVYIVDSGNFRVQVLSPEGKFVRQIGELGMRFGQFARPKGIAVSPEGFLFISDSRTHGITVYDSDGTLLLTWGMRGWDKGLFELPAGMHIDEEGRVYVVSQWTARVDIFQYLTYPEDRELKEKALEEKALQEEKERQEKEKALKEEKEKNLRQEQQQK